MMSERRPPQGSRSSKLSLPTWPEVGNNEAAHTRFGRLAAGEQAGMSKTPANNYPSASPTVPLTKATNRVRNCSGLVSWASIGRPERQPFALHLATDRYLGAL